MSLEACAQIATAALDAGIAPIARVPNGEYAIATRALDNGALGIVMPHVDTAEEAREVVNRLKYPPVGHRSMGGIGPHYGLRSASSSEAAGALNAANLTIVMLETPTAIANADEIAAVPGVDVLLIGTNDLCAEMAIHGDFGNQRVADAYGKMIAAARKHGKFPGMAGVYNETIMPRYIAPAAAPGRLAPCRILWPHHQLSRGVARQRGGPHRRPCRRGGSAPNKAGSRDAGAVGRVAQNRRRRSGPSGLAYGKNWIGRVTPALVAFAISTMIAMSLGWTQCSSAGLP